MTMQVEPFIRLTTETSEQFQEILTPEALEFVGDLDRTFSWIRNELSSKTPYQTEEARLGGNARFSP